MQQVILEGNLAQRWSRVKDFFEENYQETFWQDTRQCIKDMLKGFLEICLEEELEEQIGVRRYGRDDLRVDYRNGYYRRDIHTDIGFLEGIRVPRGRNTTFPRKVFKRYQRKQEKVNDVLLEVFLAGVSTRRVSEAVEPLLEVKYSASTISRIAKRLDPLVRKFHQRPLSDEYQYLILDALTLSIKGALGAKKKRVLVAYGITYFGQRELIDFRQAPSESQAAWEAFVNNLYQRGLKGDNLVLITTDGCKGLHAALDTVCPYTPRQRCWVHKLRNVANYLPRKYQKECLGEAKRIYTAKNRREAIKAHRQWEQKWFKLAPRAVECLKKDLDELLNFLACPEKHRVKVRTTNAIERAFREVRRRVRTMNCFTNAQSCDRIIFAIITYMNRKWKEKPLKGFSVVKYNSIPGQFT